jgi:uncharacterized protein
VSACLRAWSGRIPALGVALSLALLSTPAWATPAFEAPALRGRVNDYAQLLTASSAQQLEDRLAAFESKTGHQFSLLTVPSLNGMPIEQYSIKVAEAWKLGSAKADDGLILVIAPGDRKMRIEVGYGLEGVIPDAIAARVVREVLQPAFTRGDFAYGIEAAFDTLIQAAGGDGQQLRDRVRPAAQHAARPGISLFLLIPIGLFVFFSMLFGGRSRRRGFWGSSGFGGGGFGGGGFGGGGFGGGGFGGGGGGGGFGGGGGGGFGGGGASGSW